MGAFDTTTTKPIEAHGIYQSTCACRTAVNLYAGDTAPHCLSCGARVVWRLVQAVQPKGAVPRRPNSEPRLRAPEIATHLGRDSSPGDPRPRLDSVAGD
jgi:hypothetical protein